MNDVGSKVDVFNSLRIQAQNEIALIGDRINELEHEFKDLRERQKRLRAVIKAAQEPDLLPKPKSSAKNGKVVSITDKTRDMVMDSIRRVCSESVNNQFTLRDLADDLIAHDRNPASVPNAAYVLRNEGVIRRIGKQGLAQVYCWVGE